MGNKNLELFGNKLGDTFLEILATYKVAKEMVIYYKTLIEVNSVKEFEVYEDEKRDLLFSLNSQLEIFEKTIIFIENLICVRG